MTKLLHVTISGLLCLLFTMSLDAVTIGPFEAVGAVDGNTLWIIMPHEGQVVRMPVVLAGVAAPALYSGAQQQPEGRQARSMLDQIISEGEPHVLLWSPGDDFHYDDYGRLIAIIWRKSLSDNVELRVSLQEQVVAAGYGVYTGKSWELAEGHPDSEATDIWMVNMAQMERTARAARFGLWGKRASWVWQQFESRADD